MWYDPKPFGFQSGLFHQLPPRGIGRTLPPPDRPGDELPEPRIERFPGRTFQNEKPRPPLPVRENEDFDHVADNPSHVVPSILFLRRNEEEQVLAAEPPDLPRFERPERQPPDRRPYQREHLIAER